MERLTLVKVAETSEIPAGQMKVVNLAEKEVLIANINNIFYAIGNNCTHMHGDISKGTLEGNIVTCPSTRQNLMLQLAKSFLAQRFL